jgi:hypothetical protein
MTDTPVIIRYRCPTCGIEVRAEEGAPYKACACVEPYEAEPEATE